MVKTEVWEKEFQGLSRKVKMTFNILILKHYFS